MPYTQAERNEKESREKMKLISLGRNCEVSFQIQQYLGKGWESSLFSWAYVLNDELLLRALNDPEDLLRGETHFHYPTEDMFIDEKYQITFHGRTPKSEMLDESGQIIDNEKYTAALTELRSRVAHLTEKFRADLASEEPTAYFYKLMLYYPQDPQYVQEKVAFVRELYDWFLEHKAGSEWRLVIVVEEACREFFAGLADTRLIVETVSFFAPDSDTLNGADRENWQRIFARAEELLEPKREAPEELSAGGAENASARGNGLKAAVKALFKRR